VGTITDTSGGAVVPPINNDDISSDIVVISRLSSSSTCSYCSFLLFLRGCCYHDIARILGTLCFCNRHQRCHTYDDDYDLSSGVRRSNLIT
jgi:hypothetical protein